MKTYVIMLTRTFPKGHRRGGEETHFRQAFAEHSKIHTIRGNYELWKKRFKEIDEGNACLSIRVWEGKPYRSKQIEIAQLTASDNVAIQKLLLSSSEWVEKDGKHFCYWAEVNGKEIDLGELAKNDGFSDIGDYLTWFSPDMERQRPDRDGWKHLELAIIHFTRFRY